MEIYIKLFTILRKNIDKIFLYLCIVFVIILPLTWYRGKGEFFLIHDFMFVLDENFFKKYLYLWNEYILGCSSFVTSIPILVPFGVVNSTLFYVGLDYISVQKIIFVLTFFLPFASSLYFFSRLSTKIQLYLIPSLFYTFNFYLLCRWHEGSGPHLMFAYSLLPLQLSILVRKSRCWKKDAVFLAVLSLGWCGSWCNPPMAFYPLLPILFFLFGAFLNKNFYLVKTITLYFILFALINIFWIIGFFLTYYDTFFSGMSTSNINNASVEYPSLSAQRGGILGQFLMNGDWLWFVSWAGRGFYSFGNDYRASYFLYFLGLIIPVLSVFSLLAKNTRKNVLLICCSVFLVVSLFFGKGLQPPFGKTVFTFCLNHVPLFWFFRNPQIKFGILLPLCFSVMLFFSLETFFDKVISSIKRHVIRKMIAGGVIVFLIATLFLYSYPLITGLAVREKKEGDWQEHVAKMPESFYKIKDVTTSEQNETKRILQFPRNAFGMFRWGGEGADILDQFINNTIVTDLTGTFGYESSAKLVNNIYKTLERGNDNSLNGFLGLANIGYILIRDDLYTTSYNMGTDKIKHILNRNKKINVPMFKDRFFVLYKVDETKLNKKIYVSTTKETNTNKRQ